jgi:hypothetical protein
MNKKYLNPEMCIVKVDGTNMIANSPVSQVSGNAGFTYGGGSSNAGTTPAARVKEQGVYDVWQDDWSAE